jgi:hypothetical protein
MIAWEPKPYIFVHIPKCAGTSIEEALISISTPYLGFKDFPYETRGMFWLPGPQMLQHSKLRRYARHFSLAEYFKFAFVRNPWERTVSQIEYLKSNGVRLFATGDFKENIRNYCDCLVNYMGHDLGSCQLDYLLGPGGEVEVDYIGRFENLAADFAHVCTRLGIEPVPGLPHFLNSHRAQRYRAYYDEESRKWVQVRFAQDIAYFGYEF